MSKISAPKATPEALTPDEMVSYVKDVLVPIADKFVKNHEGKAFTKSDIEGLYKELSNALDKDPRIVSTWGAIGFEHNRYEHMASDTYKVINKEPKLNEQRVKLIQGFSNFCKKIGLGAIESACMKYVQKHTNKINLNQELDNISANAASIKTSINVGNSESAKVAKPIENPKIVKPKAEKLGKHAQKIMDERQKGNDGLSR